MSSSKIIEQKLNELMQIDSNDSELKTDRKELEPIEAPVRFQEGSRRKEESVEKEEDFVHVRETLHSMMEKGQIALEHVLRELAFTNHPRAAEVAATLIKTISETGGSLIDLHSKMESETTTNNTNNKTQNNFFVGTPKDLIQAMKEANKEDVIDVTTHKSNE